MSAFCDLHCHLDFAEERLELARGIEDLGASVFSNMVHPADYDLICHEFVPYPHVRIGLGLHPWWVAYGRVSREEVALAAELAKSARFIGEVGLDFAKRFAGTEQAQVDALESVLKACAPGGGRVFSFHGVHACDILLDLVERYVAGGNVCILHWFSGSNEQLQRAVRLGCFFSVGERMLESRRGREYVKAIPEDRLLLETDAPSEPGERLQLDAWQAQLGRTLVAIEQLRDEDLADLVHESSLQVLGLQ
ncbi:MAG: TatD family hydrolase [Actinomycetota bacterium]|nr:TatD family hydrolase [Actinomycetota bacterium]